MAKRKYKIPDIEQVEDLLQPENIEPKIIEDDPALMRYIEEQGAIKRIMTAEQAEVPSIQITPSRLSIRHCSACGGDHDGIVEYELSEPLMDGLHIVGTHYAICPTTEQIVYIRHLKEE